MNCFTFWIINSYWVAASQDAMGNTVRERMQEYLCMYTCVEKNMHISTFACMQNTNKACGKERERYLYWGRFLVYLYILLFWFEEDVIIHIYNHGWEKNLSIYELPFSLPKQFLCLSSFTGLLPISLKESLSWIHERQKTKLKLLRLWSPFDLSSNPNPATSSLWNHGSITYLLWAQFSLQQNAGNENLPPHRCNED